MDFDLREHTILLTLAGSRAYGMHTETSDVDLKGICVAPEKYYLGTRQFEQSDKPGNMQCFLGDFPQRIRVPAVEQGMEGTVYEVRKFLALAANANPNILDVLFCREEDVILTSPSGALLRENREKFLTKKCLMTFLGYAKAQLDRIETHRKYLLDPPTHEPTREEFGLPKRDDFPQDQVLAAAALIKKKVDSWNIDFVDIDEATKIFVQDQMYTMLTEMHLGSDERYALAGKLLGYDTNFMDFICKQRLYDQAVHRWSAYQTWKKERNKERAGFEGAMGWDYKHGSHLARLIVACRTIFETGTLSVYNPEPWVIDIRQGRVSYEALTAWAAEQRAGLAELAAKSTLPSRVNPEWLDALCVEVVKTGLSKT